MKVSEAVATRRSVRAFTDQPVEREILTRILEKAQRSPSGGNTQPWHGIVLTGDPMNKLFDRIAEEFPKGRAAHAPEYDIYPPELDGAYEQRRFGVGEDIVTVHNANSHVKSNIICLFTCLCLFQSLFVCCLLFLE